MVLFFTEVLLMKLNWFSLSFLIFDVFSYMWFSRYMHTGFPMSGDEGIRTLDPLLARQVLSQLSYTPIGFYVIDFSSPSNSFV